MTALPNKDKEGEIIDMKPYGDWLIISYRTKYGIAFTKIKLGKYDKD